MFTDLLAKSGQFDRPTIKAIEDGLTKSGTNPIIEANKEKIGAVYNTEAGRGLISDLHRAHLTEVDRKVDRVIDAAKPENKQFLESKTGRAIIGNIHNQFGNADAFTQFASGKGPSRFNGRNHKLEGPMDLDKALDYMKDYKYFQQNLVDFERREGIYRKLDKEAGGQASEPKDEPQARPDENPQPTPGPEPKADAGEADGDDDYHAAGKAKMIAQMDTPESDYEEVMLKHPKRWTESELDIVMGSEDYWDGGPRQGEAPSKAKVWFDTVHGERSRPAPTSSKPPQDGAGGDLMDGVRRVGERVAHAAKATSWPDAVQTLQAGINRFAADPPGGEDPVSRIWSPILRQDGDFGPKTSLALKQGVAAAGTPAMLDAFDEAWRIG